MSHIERAIVATTGGATIDVCLPPYIKTLKEMDDYLAYLHSLGADKHKCTLKIFNNPWLKEPYQISSSVNIRIPGPNEKASF